MLLAVTRAWCSECSKAVKWWLIEHPWDCLHPIDVTWHSHTSLRQLLSGIREKCYLIWDSNSDLISVELVLWPQHHGLGVTVIFICRTISNYLQQGNEPRSNKAEIYVLPQQLIFFTNLSFQFNYCDIFLKPYRPLIIFCSRGFTFIEGTWKLDGIYWIIQLMQSQSARQMALAHSPFVHQTRNGGRELYLEVGCSSRCKVGGPYLEV